MKKAFIYVILASAFFTAVFVTVGILVGLNIADNSSGTAAPDQSETAFNTANNLVAGGSNNSIRIPGFKKMVLKADTFEQSVNLYNPEENNCYFRITLALADGTELFQSGMIKPGQKIDKIEITRHLKAGTYKNAVLQYDCYALESLQPLNGSETVLDLEVIP